MKVPQIRFVLKHADFNVILENEPNVSPVLDTKKSQMF